MEIKTDERIYHLGKVYTPKEYEVEKQRWLNKYNEQQCKWEEHKAECTFVDWLSGY
jgi:hypothetical protein